MSGNHVIHYHWDGDVAEEEDGTDDVTAGSRHEDEDDEFDDESSVSRSESEGGDENSLSANEPDNSCNPRLQSVREKFKIVPDMSPAAAQHKFTGYDLSEIDKYATAASRWPKRSRTIGTIFRRCVRRHGKVFKAYRLFRPFAMCEDYGSTGGSWSVRAGVRELIQNWYAPGLISL